MEKASLSRIYFNFFISSICTQPMLAEESDLFFSTLMELLASSKRFIIYHEKVFKRQLHRISRQSNVCLTKQQKKDIE